MQMLKLVLAGLPVFLALDALWLGLLAKDAYRQGLGPLARRSGDGIGLVWWSAGVVYILALVGLAAFVVPKASDPAAALAWGALFGVILYAVYDFTNYATLQGWSLKLSVLDAAWGAVVCGVTAAAMRATQAWLA